jgi:hypothetical protein
VRDFDINSQQYRSVSTSGRNASYGMAQDTFPAAASDGFPNFDSSRQLLTMRRLISIHIARPAARRAQPYQVSAAVSHLGWRLFLGFKAVGLLLKTSSAEQNKARRPFNERGKWGQSLSYCGKMTRRCATFRISTTFMLSTISPYHFLPFSKPCGPRSSLQVFAEVQRALVQSVNAILAMVGLAPLGRSFSIKMTDFQTVHNASRSSVEPTTGKITHPQATVQMDTCRP